MVIELIVNIAINLLPFTLAHAKGQGQGNANFDCKLQVSGKR